MTEALDLDALAQNASAEMVVKHPVTGAATGGRITLAGPEHPDRKAMVFARMRRARSDFERTGKIAVSDPEEDAAAEVDLLARCTLGWSGLVAGGQPLVYTQDAARALYADPRRAWLRDQVRAALDARELFIGGSATP